MSSKREDLVDRLMFLGQMGSTETALFHQKAAERYGMGITDMKTISALMQEGSMTAGEIGNRLHITTGAVTNLIDRLEEKGVVRRVTDPTDRRKVIVEVIMQSFDSKDNAYESVGRAYAELLKQYTDKELAFLIAYHEKQIELTKDQIAKLSKSKL